jgi:D-alanyl-D-alanine carboxypeptidase/D-alanyl-D-alanine carboxypeptidase (penicillin-binding protein 5/6)
VSSASREERRLIAVTVDAPDDWNDHAYLLEEGFSRYSPRRVVTAGEQVAVLDVVGGESGTVEILAAKDYVYSLAPEEYPRLAIPGPGFVYAPAVEGAAAGYVYVLIEGNAVGKVPVVYGQTVEMKQEEEKSIWQKLVNRDP